MDEPQLTLGQIISTRRFVGKVKYIGETQFAKGIWVGLELDNPLGKNDGSVAGVRYFDCKPTDPISNKNYGLFIQYNSLIKKIFLNDTPSSTTSSVPTSRSSESNINEQKQDNQQFSSDGSRISSSDISYMNASLTSDNSRILIKEENQKLKHIIEKLEYKIKLLQNNIKNDRLQLETITKQHRKLENSYAQQTELFEMATLDKETMEEFLAVKDEEIDQLKRKIQETDLEISILKDEKELQLGNENISSTELHVQQLEIRNKKLQDALLQLNDLTSTEEKNLKEKISSLESKNKELVFIKTKYDALQIKINESEDVIENLRQQLDAAIGSEEITENLIEQNLILTRKIQSLQETVTDLESLKELGDELEKNHLETENDLHSKLDEKEKKIVFFTNELEEANLTIQSYEKSIKSLRDLIKKLETDLEKSKSFVNETSVDSDSNSITKNPLIQKNNLDTSYFETNSQVLSTCTDMTKSFILKEIALKNELIKHIGNIESINIQNFKSVYGFLYLNSLFSKGIFLFNSIIYTFKSASINWLSTQFIVFISSLSLTLCEISHILAYIRFIPKSSENLDSFLNTLFSVDDFISSMSIFYIKGDLLCDDSRLVLSNLSSTIIELKEVLCTEQPFLNQCETIKKICSLFLNIKILTLCCDSSNKLLYSPFIPFELGNTISNLNKIDQLLKNCTDDFSSLDLDSIVLIDANKLIDKNFQSELDLFLTSNTSMLLVFKKLPNIILPYYNSSNVLNQEDANNLIAEIEVLLNDTENEKTFNLRSILATSTSLENKMSNLKSLLISPTDTKSDNIQNILEKFDVKSFTESRADSNESTQSELLLLKNQLLDEKKKLWSKDKVLEELTSKISYLESKTQKLFSVESMNKEMNSKLTSLNKDRDSLSEKLESLKKYIKEQKEQEKNKNLAAEKFQKKYGYDISIWSLEIHYLESIVISLCQESYSTSPFLRNEFLLDSIKTKKVALKPYSENISYNLIKKARDISLNSYIVSIPKLGKSDISENIKVKKTAFLQNYVYHSMLSQIQQKYDNI